MPANKYSRISCVIYLFFVAIIAELFPIIRDIRYILIPILALPIIWHLYTTKKSFLKTNFARPFFHMIWLCVFLSAISIVLMMVKNVWNLAFVKEILFMILPMLMAWTLLAFSNKHDCNFIIDCFFYFTTATFFIRYGLTLSLSGIGSVSFRDSFSPYESELVDIFLPLSFYYMFGNKRLFKAIISILLCWLSMKRIHELFLLLYIVLFIITFLFPSFRKHLYYGRLPKFLEIIFIVFVCAFPILLVAALSTDALNTFMLQHFGISFNAFMLGRESMYRAILSNADGIAGLGSTRAISVILFGGNDMHSDILRLYLETTLVGLVAYVLMFFSLMKRKWILVLYLGFVLAVMLVSPIITSTIGFTCIYVILFALDKRTMNRKTTVRKCPKVTEKGVRTLGLNRTY